MKTEIKTEIELFKKNKFLIKDIRFDYISKIQIIKIINLEKGKVIKTYYIPF